MTAHDFNDDWTVGPNVSVFSEITGGATVAERVRLPHDAMLALPRSASAAGGSSTGYFEGGAVTYRKVFTAPEEWRDRVIELSFDGVYRDAMVYLNGVLVGQRPNGYAPFRVRLNEALRYGDENRLRVDARAYRDSRWYSGLGIYRSVELLDLPLVHLEPAGTTITTPDIDGERAVVAVRTVLRNEGLHPVTVDLRTRVVDPSGAVVASGVAPVTIRPGRSATSDQRLYVRSPALWSVDSPHLHRVEIDLVDDDEVVDATVQPLGIRRLQLDPAHGLRINGEVVTLRGACIHHDNGVLGAVSVADAEYRRVRILKSAGFNAIRSAHNPAGRELLDACDRLGMLVMDEAFDMWTEGKQPFDYSLAFPEWWERDLEAMISRDVNHPSVIMYSIGNEILDAGKPLGAALGRELAAKVRALDPTRFITNGISGFVATLTDTVPMIQDELAGVPGGINDVEGIGKEVLDRVSRSQFVTDAIAESHSVVDVVGHNYAAWRYEAEREQFPNRVVVGTETNPKDIAENWRLVERLPHAIGDFTWTGWDYLGEAGLGVTTHSADGRGWEGGEYPALLAYCGDIDITGFRRPASYYRQIVFGLRREPFIAVHHPRPGLTAASLDWAWTDSTASWTWDVPSGSPLTVDVYSDADEVELFLNDRSLGVQPAGRDHEFTASFTVDYAPGELRAVALREGDPAETALLATAGPAAAIVAAIDAGGPGEYLFITITLVDERGVVVPGDDRSVSVTVAGAAELAGLGSGRPSTEESFLASTFTTFEGRGLAVVRVRASGTSRIEISSEGLRSAVMATPESVKAASSGAPFGGGDRQPSDA